MNAKNHKKQHSQWEKIKEKTMKDATCNNEQQSYMSDNKCNERCQMEGIILEGSCNDTSISQ